MSAIELREREAHTILVESSITIVLVFRKGIGIL